MTFSLNVAVSELSPYNPMVNVLYFCGGAARADESKIEKSESWFLEGLCSVESSKGKRLTKIRKGFYKPPTQRICVPGFHWTATLLSALGQTPSVCQMSWWTSRGKYQEVGTNIIFRMLKKLHKTIGNSVLHVLDRGYANAWTIEWMNEFKPHRPLDVVKPNWVWNHQGFGSAGPPVRENRLKLLAIVALVYDFLLLLLRNWSHWIPLFLRHWCHRTGNRYRNASIPIYRLRIAISHALYTACCACQSSG